MYSLTNCQQTPELKNKKSTSQITRNSAIRKMDTNFNNKTIIKYVYKEILIIPNYIVNYSSDNDFILLNLNLSNNLINKIPPDLFINNKNIKYMNFNNNQISEIPKEIKYLTNLEELNLSKNNIENIPTEIYYIDLRKL